MSKLEKKEKEYFTFEDLEFVERRPAKPEYGLDSDEQALLDFKNGWGVSVIRGGLLTDECEFELAVMRDGHINYDTEVTDDVLRFDSVDELNACLRDVQDLDENGVIQRPKEKDCSADVKQHIERRKAQIKKARVLRRELEKRHPEERISNVALADEIAEAKISGKEKRTITPEVGEEIKRRKAFEHTK